MGGRGDCWMDACVLVLVVVVFHRYPRCIFNLAGQVLCMLSMAQDGLLLH